MTSKQLYESSISYCAFFRKLIIPLIVKMYGATLLKEKTNPCHGTLQGELDEAHFPKSGQCIWSLYKNFGCKKRDRISERHCQSFGIHT